MSQSKSVEDLLFDFLIAEQTANRFDTNVKILPHPYFDLDTETQSGPDTFLIIGDAHGMNTGEIPVHGWIEMNARLTVEIQSRVANEDKTERVPARQKVFETKQAFIQLIEANNNLGESICDVSIDFENRFFDDTKADKWSVQPIGLIFNRRGK